MDFRKIGALGIGAALVAGACSSTVAGSPAASSSAAGDKSVKLGITFPISGGDGALGLPTANGAKLAADTIKVAGYSISSTMLDDAVNGIHDPQQGAKNLQQLIGDKSVFAVVGPLNSNVAKAMIPISNAAGIAFCAPASTNLSLTKPEYGAADLRKTNPDKITFIRVATTDDIQGAAAADMAFNQLHAKTAYVVDDTETYGKALADVFVTEFEKLGGKVVARDGAGKNITDYTSLLTAAKEKGPEVVFFGGVTSTGGGLLRKQMVQQGMASIPFIGGDGINDGALTTQGSFLNLVGADGAANTYSTGAVTHDIPDADKITAAYKAEFKSDPSAYTAGSYACAQVFLQALQAVGPDREAVRAYVTDTTHTFDTVLGKISFDKNGDTTQRIISYFKFDAATGDFAFFQQKDFGATK